MIHIVLIYLLILITQRDRWGLLAIENVKELHNRVLTLGSALC